MKQNCDKFKLNSFRRVGIPGVDLLKYLSQGMKMHIEDRWIDFRVEANRNFLIIQILILDLKNITNPSA